MGSGSNPSITRSVPKAQALLIEIAARLIGRFQVQAVKIIRPLPIEPFGRFKKPKQRGLIIRQPTNADWLA